MMIQPGCESLKIHSSSIISGRTESARFLRWITKRINAVMAEQLAAIADQTAGQIGFDIVPPVILFVEGKSGVRRAQREDSCFILMGASPLGRFFLMERPATSF